MKYPVQRCKSLQDRAQNLWGLVKETAIDKDGDGRRANSKITLTHVKKNVVLFSHFVLNWGGQFKCLK